MSQLPDFQNERTPSPQATTERLRQRIYQIVRDALTHPYLHPENLDGEEPSETFRTRVFITALQRITTILEEESRQIPDETLYPLASSVFMGIADRTRKINVRFVGHN